MLLIRSPSIIVALIFSIFSISLTILTVNIGYNHPQHQIQFLIILPPINSILLFLFSLIWIERRFRLSYMPFICIIILLLSCLTLTIISYLLLSSSIILYLNFIFYLLITILLFLIILIIIISYFSDSLYTRRYRHMISIKQPNNHQLSISNDIYQFDKFILKSNENEFFLFVSKLSNQYIDYDINNFINSLNQININVVLTLNATNKLSYMNTINNKNSNIDLYSIYLKRTNIEHIIYPIHDHGIPKSISDYMQFLYTIIITFNHNHLFINYMGGMERIGMTIVCFELLYDYIMNENEQKNEQKFIERFYHYPFLLKNSCRVCQSISNVRKIRPISIHNPLQILYVHEFYARLKSASYMERIKSIINCNNKNVTNYFLELHGAIDI